MYIHHTGRDGIKTQHADNVVIENNEIGFTGVRDASNAEGIDVMGSIVATIRGNYVHDTATTAFTSKQVRGKPLWKPPPSGTAERVGINPNRHEEFVTRADCQPVRSPEADPLQTAPRETQLPPAAGLAPGMGGADNRALMKESAQAAASPDSVLVRRAAGARPLWSNVSVRPLATGTRSPHSVVTRLLKDASPSSASAQAQ